jgi:hypothetical protein
MKYIIILFVMFSLMLTGSMGFAQKFSRDLPKGEFSNSLTPQRFPNQDAVIILDENITVISETSVFNAYPSFEEYFDENGDLNDAAIGGNMRNGLSTAKRRILIVKLFNDAAIRRYGSFEYNYLDYGKAQNIFSAMVRVAKPDGKVWEMPNDLIKIENLTEYKDQVFARKVVFKVPNLAPGDILQIEHVSQEWFNVSSTISHYFNRQDPILFANFSVTLPAHAKVTCKCIPAELVPQPGVNQASQSRNPGDTYYWNLRNVPGIPQEPFSPPFSEQAMMAALMVESWGRYGKKEIDWKTELKEFYKSIDGKDVSPLESGAMKVSVFDYSAEIPVDKMWKMVADLYTGIRLSLKVEREKGVNPKSKQIQKVLKNAKGSSSDLSYIMFRMLKALNYDVRLALLRDRREGRFPREIPAITWFDRLGVWVKIGSNEKLYDFSPASTPVYSPPWFLDRSEIVLFDKHRYEFRILDQPSRMEDNVIRETHRLTLGTDGAFDDRLVISSRGMNAQDFRLANFGETRDQMAKKYRELLAETCLNTFDDIGFNTFLEEPEAIITASGAVKNPGEAFNNLITFKLPVHQLTLFRESLFTSVRSTNLDFHAPFQVQMQYDVTLPAGFRMKTELRNRAYLGEMGMAGNIEYSAIDSHFQATVTVNFPEPVMGRKTYPDLIRFLDNMLQELNSDIVLQKI